MTALAAGPNLHYSDAVEIQLLLESLATHIDRNSNYTSLSYSETTRLRGELHAVSWATLTDIGGRFGGTTSAFMKMASSLSAMVSPVSAAWLAAAFGSFHTTLAVAAGSCLIGGLLWLRPPLPT